MPPDSASSSPPEPRKAPMVDYSSKAAFIGGTPLAVVTVWAIETFYLPPGDHLPATVAVAAGTIGATVFGELWKAFKALLDRWVAQ